MDYINECEDVEVGGNWNIKSFKGIVEYLWKYVVYFEM